MKSLFVTLLLCVPALADEDVVACDSTAGFDAGGATISATDGKVVFAYDRSKMAPLARYDLLSEFKELKLRFFSKEAGTFVVCLKDRDGATWHAGFRAEAGAWTDAVVTPKQFELNADSAVKKPALDPARLGAGWVLVDGAAFTGGKGANEIRIDEIRVVREEPLASSGEWIVGGNETVAKSRRHAGTIVVKAGATLRVTAPRFVLDGTLRMEGGTVEFAGGVFDLPQRFNHERTLELRGDARLAFAGCTVMTHFPAKVNMDGAQSFEVKDTECAGGFTVDVPPKSKVVLSGAHSPGEFVIAPGGAVSVKNSKGVILWLALGPNFKGTLELPGAAIEEPWTPGCGLDVTVEKSSGLKWGLVSVPGSDGTVQGCEAAACGLVFGGETALALKDVVNGRALKTWRVPASDRNLSFAEVKVGAWNLYASDKAGIKARDCTLGEIMTWKKAQVSLENGAVDGAGGYVAAEDDSHIVLSHCRITCLVVAKGNSTILLEDCDITGDVRAVGTSRIRLRGSRIKGNVLADGGASIVQE